MKTKRKFFRQSWCPLFHDFSTLIEFFHTDMTVMRDETYPGESTYLIRIPDMVARNYAVIHMLDKIGERYAVDYQGTESKYARFISEFKGRLLTAPQVATMLAAIMLDNDGGEYIPLNRDHILAVNSAWTKLPGTDIEVFILGHLDSEGPDVNDYGLLVHNGLEWVEP